MSDWTPDAGEPAGDDDAGDPAAIAVVTDSPLPLRIARIEHPRASPDMAAFGTFVEVDGERRVIAQGELPPRVLESLLASPLFAAPRFLMLRAREAPPGIVAEMTALLPELELQAWASTLGDEPSENEPWKASVPAPPSFDTSPALSEPDSSQPPTLVPFPLGVLHRYAANREHPDDLAKEAVALFGAVLGGTAVNTDAKQIDNLLGGL